ncbi:MAG TPA: Asd/ArgC dimerization domain-containing protein, partial [Gaiellales bacterium]|nr:Asd/ArgC dimerization domain-containing protein [Gaiellales bacterium]
MSTLAATATVGVAGASGYAGGELVRLLAGHPRLAVAATSRDPGDLAGCDVAVLALPHGASAAVATELAERGMPVVDMSRDLRGVWTYGLPELHRDRLASAAVVANPGCYATAALLALAPLVESGVVEGPIVVDGKSGVSGAGKTPAEATHLCVAGEGIAAYSPVGHPHQEEIERELGELAGAGVTVTFTPHLAPFSRGLLVTAYARLAGELDQPAADRLYAGRYANEPFVEMVDQPRTQRVRGANVCQIAVHVDPVRGMVVVVAALDN